MDMITHSLAPNSRIANRLAPQHDVFKGVLQNSRNSKIPYPETKITREATGTTPHEWRLSDNGISLSIIVCLRLLRCPFERFNAPLPPTFLQAFLLLEMSTPAIPAIPAILHINQIVALLADLLTVLFGGRYGHA
jgi:hypothetical protein